ncbi:hypothetical protein BVRB_1g009760 [Beta vulgaris subsp. vulgaris]|nr:hypothetical protein BVRB_1g009760 [Beta vulgaris subsp. vulgaris]
MFDGNGPKLWMKKCLKYCTLYKISYYQKVDLASVHMTGIADSYFHSYITVRVILNEKNL